MATRMRRETDTSRGGRGPAGTWVPRGALLLLFAVCASGCADFDASVDALALQLERHVPHTHVSEGPQALPAAPSAQAFSAREPASPSHVVRIRGQLIAGLALKREALAPRAVESGPLEPPQKPPLAPPTLARTDEHPWAHQVLRRDTHPWAYQVRSPAVRASVAHTEWAEILRGRWTRSHRSREVTRPSGDGPSQVASSAPPRSSHARGGRETLARRGRVSRAVCAHPPSRTAQARQARTRGSPSVEARAPGGGTAPPAGFRAGSRRGPVERSTSDPPVPRSVPPPEGRLRVPCVWLFAA